jgi:hypothetical protein
MEAQTKTLLTEITILEKMRSIKSMMKCLKDSSSDENPIKGASFAIKEVFLLEIDICGYVDKSVAELHEKKSDYFSFRLCSGKMVFGRRVLYKEDAVKVEEELFNLLFEQCVWNEIQAQYYC